MNNCRCQPRDDGSGKCVITCCVCLCHSSGIVKDFTGGVTLKEYLNELAEEE